jgi:Pre-mRNA-splicing factor of RES complex
MNRGEKLKHQETQKFANTMDDEEYNKTLKAWERWDDPAAAFLSTESKMKKSKRFKSTVPVYMGVARLIGSRFDRGIDGMGYDPFLLANIR